MKDFGLSTGNNIKSHYVVKTLPFFLLLLFFFKITSAQTNNITVKRFSVKNEKISDAIIKLSNQSNFNFSYDASDQALNKKITYTANNKTVTSILDEILKNSGNTYKRIGNQIVIYKTGENEKTVTPETSNVSKKNTGAPKQINKKIPFTEILRHTDTLLVIDTLIVRDTIVKTDTLRITDTVTIIKKDKNKPRKTKNFPVDYFSMQNNRDKGWAATIYFAPLLTNFSFTQEPKPLSFRSFYLGGNVSYLKKNWELSAGMQLSHFANKFTYSHTVTKGGYYLADTIDAYYTVTGTDTSWYYVTDSVWQPLQTFQSAYDRINRIGYLEFNFSAAYDFYKTKSKILFLRLGTNVGFPLYQKGTAFVNEAAVDFDNLTFGSPMFSTFIGTGIKYKVSPAIDLSGEVFYTKYFRSVTTGLPQNIYPDNLGFKMGLVFYLQ